MEKQAFEKSFIIYKEGIPRDFGVEREIHVIKKNKLFHFRDTWKQIPQHVWIKANQQTSLKQIKQVMCWQSHLELSSIAKSGRNILRCNHCGYESKINPFDHLFQECYQSHFYCKSFQFS